MQVILHKAGPYEVSSIKCPAKLGPANLMPRRAVLHTTEGGFDGSLQIFKKHYAPHFLISASTIAQLVPIGIAGSALKAHNVDALVQIELVGFSKEEPWFPDKESANHLAAVMATCWSLFGIPLLHPWKDGDYGRAGKNTPHRKSGKWEKTGGWYGHGDVPDNDHWDPGNLKWSELLALAATYIPVSTTPKAINNDSEPRQSHRAQRPRG